LAFAVDVPVFLRCSIATSPYGAFERSREVRMYEDPMAADVCTRGRAVMVLGMLAALVGASQAVHAQGATDPPAVSLFHGPLTRVAVIWIP
jgi:hypothetical protein